MPSWSIDLFQKWQLHRPFHVDARLLGLVSVLLLVQIVLVGRSVGKRRTVASGDPLAHNPALNAVPSWHGAHEGLLNTTCPETEHFELLKLHDALRSPIIRTGPNQVHIADPTSHKIVFSQGTRFEKAPLYDLYNAETGKPNLFTSRNVTQHASRRRILSHAFAPSSLVEFRWFIADRIAALVDRFHHAAVEGSYVDVFAAYQEFTGDIISKFAFGREDHMVETAQLNALIRGIRRRTGSKMGSLYLYQVLRRVPFGLYLVRFLPQGRLRTEVEAIRDLNVLMSGYVDEFVARKSDDPHEILNKLIKARDPMTGQGLDKETLIGESRGLVVAGVETTAAALTYITYQLALHQDWYQRLQTELKHLIPDLDAFLSDLAHNIPEEKQVMKLPFFNALLKETYRCYPAGVRPFPRTVPPQGATLDGVFLPGGTEVTCSSWVQSRWDRALWGKDAEEFRPERWLEAQQEDLLAKPISEHQATLGLEEKVQQAELPSGRYAKMSSSITTFSNGPRGCIGRNLATLILHLTCVSVLRCVQPGVNQDPSSKDKPARTTPDEMEFIGTFVGNPKAHKLELKWGRVVS